MSGERNQEDILYTVPYQLPPQLQESEIPPFFLTHSIAKKEAPFIEATGQQGSFNLCFSILKARGKAGSEEMGWGRGEGVELFQIYGP